MHRFSGLDALSGYVEQVEVRRIHHSRFPIRTESGSLEDLMASIIEKGLLQPVIVRPLSDGFEVVAGNRRLEACKKLRLGKIPCHVVELEDREAYEVSLLENIQRKTLSAMEEAVAFRNYARDFGFGGVSELARRIGKSHSYVSRRIAMLDLPIGIREEIALQHITPSVASELLPLGQEGRDEASEIVSRSKAMTRDEVRSLAKHLREEVEDAGTGATQSSLYEQERVKAYTIDRTISKCMASLRENMRRFADAISSLDDADEKEWQIREVLMWYRQTMSDEIDRLHVLRKKLKRSLEQ